MILRSIFIGLAVTLLPQVASAQCVTDQRTKDLLQKTPVGYYAQQVMERVDKGIAAAKQMPSKSKVFDLFGAHWMVSIESIIYMLVDTEMQSVEYSRDLTQVSACLHADLAIFEAKMEEVRCEIKAAQERKSLGGIGRLQSVALFLNNRYKHLVYGALNTEHQDQIWQYWHTFDEPFGGWCCVASTEACEYVTSNDCKNNNVFYPTRNDCLNSAQCIDANGPDNQPPEYDPICPFDSNYLAPTFSGYGCDLSVLSDFEDLTDTSSKTEYDALNDLITARDDFLNDTQHIKDAAITMDNILDDTMLSQEQKNHLEQFGQTKVRDVEHKHVYGCNADVPAELIGSDLDGDNDPADIVKPSTLWATHPLRGPFFFAKDHLSIWNDFLKLNLYWATQREFPDYIKTPSEFVDEEDRKKAMGKIYIAMIRDYMRNRWTQFMLGQALQEAVILPKAQDMQRAVTTVMQPLRDAMRQNVELVQDSSGGLRSFAKGYAYFLRRSCVNRQCNAQLETILKILFSDDCFPYASGTFDPTDETTSNEKDTWERCKEAVEKL